MPVPDKIPACARTLFISVDTAPTNFEFSLPFGIKARSFLSFLTVGLVSFPTEAVGDAAVFHVRSPSVYNL